MFFYVPNFVFSLLNHDFHEHSGDSCFLSVYGWDDRVFVYVDGVYVYYDGYYVYRFVGIDYYGDVYVCYFDEIVCPDFSTV